MSVLFVPEPNQRVCGRPLKFIQEKADEWGDSTSSNTPEGIVNTVGTGIN